MKTFLISDTHFGHANILNFKRKDGDVLRKFEDVYHMDQHMIDRWNSVVGYEDKVYHLGDVGFCSFSRLKEIFEQLHGRKVLIKGNHDNLKLSQYTQLFSDVRGTHTLNGIILSHIPLHPDSLGRWKGNVHGHTHYNSLEDKRYMNVSVEVVDYTPVEFNEVDGYFSI